MYSYEPPHMAVQKQDDQHEHTFSIYVRIRDAVLKTCLGRWTIGRSGERGSGISVLPARHDDDDDITVHNLAISLMSRVFFDGSGDLGSISGRVIPKILKIVLDAALLSTPHYKVRMKGKEDSPGNGVALSSTPRCYSYWEGSLRVTLDYGHQLYFFI